MANEQSLGQKLVIWGTDVNVTSCKEKFQVSYNQVQVPQFWHEKEMHLTCKW